MEFFASPNFVQALLNILGDYPFVNYHIVNRKVSEHCLVVVWIGQYVDPLRNYRLQLYL